MAWLCAGISLPTFRSKLSFDRCRRSPGDCHIFLALPCIYLRPAIMPTSASQTALLLLLLTTLSAGVAAENAGIKAKVTNAICSNGLTLNDYSIECLDDNGVETACGFGRSANINANVYVQSEIPQDDDDENGGRYVAVDVEGCLGHNCNSFVAAQHMQICAENDNGDGDGEAEGDEGEGENDNDHDNEEKEGERKLSSSAEGYTFLSSGGQGCGEAGAYDISVSGFKLDTFGISQGTWGYGGKAVTLLLTLSSSDKPKSHYSEDADDEDEGYALGYCEVTLKTGRNPPQMAIVGAITAAFCSLVFYLAYITEERKRGSKDDEKAKDYDSMTDSDDDSAGQMA